MGRRSGAWSLVLMVGASLASGASAMGAPGPPLRTATPLLEAALECVGDLPQAARAPVLLVHGTGSTPEENWPTAYVLPPQGVPVCTVRLPHRATRDVQVSVEYVVHAVRRMAALRGGPIDIVGHSQGGTLPVYALKFWPDLPALVGDYVGLAPALTSPATGDVLCANECAAPFQQLRSTSVWFRSFSTRPTPPGPAYTTIASRTDEIVFPQPQASHLDGATNIVLQDLCPAKTTDHFQMASDAAVHAIASDALTNPGAADIARLGVGVCLPPYLPGVDPVTGTRDLAVGANGAASASSEAPQLREEPPVRCYMLPTCAKAGARGRVITRAVLARDGHRLRLGVQAPGRLRVTVGARTVHEQEVVPGTLVVGLPRRAHRPITLSTRTAYYTRWATERTVRARR